MSEFFAMGGYGFYVWTAYGVTALVLVAEVLSLRARRRRTLIEARLAEPDIPVTTRSLGFPRRTNVSSTGTSGSIIGLGVQSACSCGVGASRGTPVDGVSLRP